MSCNYTEICTDSRLGPGVTSAESWSSVLGCWSSKAWFATKKLQIVFSSLVWFLPCLFKYNGVSWPRQGEKKNAKDKNSLVSAADRWNQRNDFFPKDLKMKPVYCWGREASPRILGWEERVKNCRFNTVLIWYDYLLPWGFGQGNKRDRLLLDAQDATVTTGNCLGSFSCSFRQSEH